MMFGKFDANSIREEKRCSKRSQMSHENDCTSLCDLAADLANIATLKTRSNKDEESEVHSSVSGPFGTPFSSESCCIRPQFTWIPIQQRCS